MPDFSINDESDSAATLMKESFERELKVISNWWIAHSVDEKYGGFRGEINSLGKPVAKARKGVVLNSRILWFFSQVALLHDWPDCRLLAERAYLYLIDHFFDRHNGGYFWEVDHHGNVTNDRKQVYGQAFCLFGIIAFYRLNGDQEVLQQATKLFRIIQSKCVESNFGGVTEAFRRDWSCIDDYRLSERDHNFPKTLNTHLHVLEAYTAYHAVVCTAESELALRTCVELFQTKFRRPDLHFHMFLDQQWRDHSKEISYGHEIELSWLMCEACSVLADDMLITRAKDDAVRIANQILNKAIGPSGEFFERVEFGKSIDPSSVWWVQAEAMVGFYNAYQISGENRFFRAMARIWAFVITNHKVFETGEWLWSANDRNLPLGSHANYLAGFWKGPYHNGRAMIELIQRM